MRDRTDEAPTRRMSVARGRLEGFPTESELGADLGRAEAAAEWAVKRADEIPGVHGLHPTHVETLVLPASEGLEVTVTVQGYSRMDLDTHALTGASAALLCIRHALGAPEARIVDLHLVQNVS